MKLTALACLMLSISMAPSVMAGKLNKCTSASGAVSYTDKPCADAASTQVIETRIATPGHERDAALDRMVDKVFEVERLACAEGNLDSCAVLYCRDDPGSAQCLKSTHRASGTGWYQISSQSAGLGKGRVGIHCTRVPLKERRAIDIEADVSGVWSYTAGGQVTEFPSLDAAAQSACR